MNLLQKHDFIYGNCIEGLKTFPNGVISLAITSPPYKNKDGWTPDLIKGCFEQIYRVLQDNSLFFLNFGHLKEDKFRPFKTCEYALEAGFRLNETIIWKKTQFSPIGGKKTLNNLTEFIFLLYKGKMPDLDRLSIGIPYKDKSNIGRYSDIDLRCGGNFWEIGYETIQNKSQKLHPDRFPLELPRRCIKLSGLPKNSIVLDTFAGSATTCVAAKELGMNSIGFEKDLERYYVGLERLNSI
jgi:site-specific DNA-methyltransferase (adenine-specific)